MASPGSEPIGSLAAKLDRAIAAWAVESSQAQQKQPLPSLRQASEQPQHLLSRPLRSQSQPQKRYSFDSSVRTPCLTSLTASQMMQQLLYAQLGVARLAGSRAREGLPGSSASMSQCVDDTDDEDVAPLALPSPSIQNANAFDFLTNQVCTNAMSICLRLSPMYLIETKSCQFASGLINCVV